MMPNLWFPIVLFLVIVIGRIIYSIIKNRRLDIDINTEQKKLDDLKRASELPSCNVTLEEAKQKIPKQSETSEGKPSKVDTTNRGGTTITFEQSRTSLGNVSRVAMNSGLLNSTKS